MYTSLKQIPRREIVAIIVFTAAVMTVVGALALKLGLAPLLIV